MGIKINRGMLKSGEPFFPSFAALSDQTWGGRADAELMKVSVTIQEGMRQFQAQRDKYIKQLGQPNDQGNFSMAGAPKADVIEFDKLMEETFEVEIELPIEEPIKLVKRKKTTISPFQAAALASIIEIEWPSDNGEDLDKVDKK
jgi:hypothetical protein